MSRKTKDHLDRTRETLTNDLKQEANLILTSSLEALQSGFALVEENSDKRYTEALVKLGAMNKDKKT